MNFWNILLVALGGAIGATCRYVISNIVDKSIKGTFPISTFIINMLGCLLMGIFYGLSLKMNISENYRAIIVSGILGAFTTFSTFSMEGFTMLKNGEYLLMLSYILVSIIVGLVLVFIGMKVVNIA